jgi:acetylornithine/succinyldiaminopimelate/putrescine aminotransferase
MNAFNRISILAFASLQVSCATSIKGKVFQNSLIAGTAGAVYGNSLESHPTTHAAMYGGIATAIAALATVYYLDPDQEVDKSRRTTTKLRDELDDFEMVRICCKF